MYREILLKAIDYIGSQAKVAKLCDVKQQAVSLWVQRGYLPSKHVLTLEKACKRFITRYELRPDLYPREDKAA